MLESMQAWWSIEIVIIRLQVLLYQESLGFPEASHELPVM